MSTQANWIEWKGGPNPAPGKKVDVQFRGGEGYLSESDFLHWAHKGNYGDLIAYRLAEPEKKQSATGIITYGDTEFIKPIEAPMTKRERIAALMMQAEIQSGAINSDSIAKLAVSHADALIAELKRRKEPTE